MWRLGGKVALQAEGSRNKECDKNTNLQHTDLWACGTDSCAQGSDEEALHPEDEQASPRQGSIKHLTQDHTSQC